MDGIVGVAPVWAALVSLFLYHFILAPLRLSPLSRIPGPASFALTKWRLAYEDWKGTRTRKINQLHIKYGPVVRIGPNEVAFNSLAALRTIYGPGSGFGRTEFYRMFDVYGKPNMFTFHGAKEHGNRKKLLAHGYAKSTLLKPVMTRMVEEKTKEFMDLLRNHIDGHTGTVELFSTLHYFSLDNITEFLYGADCATRAVSGNPEDRKLIADILDPARRKLSWFVVHFPDLTTWLYTRTALLERLVRPLLPMQKPSTYSGIRKYALDAYYKFKRTASMPVKGTTSQKGSSVLDRLWEHHQKQEANGLTDLEIASEAADHLLAGIDTTSDTLMFLIWALSQPQNVAYQEKLIQECRSLLPDTFNENGIPQVGATDKMTYLDAAIKETLRLYAPLPATEPRSAPVITVIDGFKIPANTVVGMSPYSLHRNPSVFKNPTAFNPDRWLGPAESVAEMKKWWWAFSSGGRMCIGMHLAMAEMTTLAATIYSSFKTSIDDSQIGVTPGITSRFEVFFDDEYPRMEEHVCLVRFTRQ